MAKSKLPAAQPSTGGRPSLYNDALGLKICEMVANGKTLRDICEMDDMPAMSTITLWAVDNPLFSAHYRRARAAASHVDGDRLANMAAACEAGTLDPAAAREAAKIRMWLAERANPKEYGTKTALEHTSPDGSMAGGPVTVVINAVKPKPEA
jgi:hypothetical protein